MKPSFQRFQSPASLKTVFNCHNKITRKFLIATSVPENWYGIITDREKGDSWQNKTQNVLIMKNEFYSKQEKNKSCMMTD